MKNRNAFAIIILLLIAVVAVVLLMPKAKDDKNTPPKSPPSGNAGNGGTSGGNNAGVAAIENADDILNSVFGFIKSIRDKRKANAQTTANISNTNIDASTYSGGIIA